MIYGKVLPDGNSDQFAKIEANLQRLSISYTHTPLDNGGAVFSFPESELAKLPHADGKPYLPVDDTIGGFAVYPVFLPTADANPVLPSQPSRG